MRANETVEKALVRKVCVKISHKGFKNELKNRQNITQNTKTWRFSMFFSHFQTISF